MIGGRAKTSRILIALLVSGVAVTGYAQQQYAALAYESERAAPTFRALDWRAPPLRSRNNATEDLLAAAFT